MPEQLPKSTAEIAAIAAERFPGHLGIALTDLSADRVTMSMPVTQRVHNLVGVVHGGAIVTLADTACGFATAANLPDGATSFTTIELKTNFLGAVSDGDLMCVATPVHRGRTTQVWDAEVTHVQTGRRVAMFRCTNLVVR